MRGIFITAFIIFIFIEIFVILQLRLRKKTIGVKSVAVSFGFFCLLVIMMYLFNLSIPYYVLLLVMAVIFIHSFFGYYLEYFMKLKTFDRYLHGFGSFSSGLLFYFLLANFIAYGGSAIFRAIYIMLLGISAGALYEVVEFMVDSKHNLSLQKGLKDTNFDLIFNILGSALAAIFAYLTFLR